MSLLNESDGPTLATTMIDPPDGFARTRQTRIRTARRRTSTGDRAQAASRHESR